MNELKLPGFNESDFAVHNPDGQLRVQCYLTAIQDARRSAQTPVEMECVLRRTEEALQLNLAEKVVAEAKFVKARGRAAHHLREALAKFERCTLWGAKRVEVQLKLEHALALFGAKHFAEAKSEAERVVAELVGANVIVPATAMPRPASAARPNCAPTTQVRRSA
jgi:hypothetical protein